MDTADRHHAPTDPGEPDADPTDFHAASLASFLGMVRDAWRRREREHDPVAPPRIGPFEVIRELGRGTFGHVLLVNDPVLGCRRAAKVPTQVVLDSPRLRRRFVHDARLASLIDHPNVVRVHQAHDNGEFSFFVMEYCPEGSLGEWLKGRPPEKRVGERWAASLVAQVADGVHRIHEQGILHRDLKPANVLLARVGRADVDADPPLFCPKVADFGLATLRDDPGASATTEGIPVGTASSMSPEQARGARKEIGPASDVYGLGAILFEVVSGRRAYPQESSEAIYASLLGDAPSPSLKEARPGVSRDLQLIVATAMRKDPQARYASAAEMADDLRRLASGRAVRGAPVARKVRSYLVERRRAVAGLALAAGVGVATLGASTARRDGEAAVWLQRLEAADAIALPGLVGGYAGDDARVRPRLEALFRGDDPGRKLAAAVALAGVRADCADFARDRLLSAPPRDLGPLARALEGRDPGLAGRLERDARPDAENLAASPGEVERLDARRANAAAALILIGRVEPGSEVLRSSPEPQARSFLIHLLRPAGVSPALLLPLLKATTDAGVRRSLLQALGDYPDVPGCRAPILAEAERLYRHDPDPGVHGSAKWLLRGWGLRPRTEAIDREVFAEFRGRYRPGFGWRITETGLTMVAVPDFGLHRPIEVSDREIGMTHYLDVFPGHHYFGPVSPEPDSPINGLDYSRAAEFCNELTFREKAGDPAYRTVPEPERTLYLPIEGHPAPSGYRLPTDVEFEVLCRAGARSRCYYGDSTSLLRHYARVTPHETPPLLAARFKPNDLGLFDTLGNLGEWATSTEAGDGPRNLAVSCGGDYAHPLPLIRCDRKSHPGYVVRVDGGLAYRGFRVVRTLDGPSR